MRSLQKGFPEAPAILKLMHRKGLILFLGLGLAILGLWPGEAQAANRYWVGMAGGSWSSSFNWATAAAMCSGAGGSTVPGSSDVAIFTSSCPSSVTINTAADLAGMEIQTGFIGTITQGSGIGVTIGSSNFSQAAGTFTGAAAAIDVNGSFTITGGTFTSTSGTLTVSGNWTHSGGTFTHNSGSVTLDGSSQALNDDNTFYNLTKSVTSADTLTLEASATQTVTNTTTLNGADCNVLSLRSSSSGSQWSINPQGTRTVSYLDVKDSNNTNPTAVSCTTGCASSGNNINWTLSGTTCSTTGSSGNTAPTASVPRSITQINDTIEFKTDINDVDGNKTQLLVEYSTDQSNWKKATISKVAASQGDATITSSATYPIASIDTDNGKIILTVTWNAKDNFASSEEDKMYLRLTPYDGTDVGSTVISESFALDTRAPVISNIYLKARTSTSLTPAWTPESEKNFDKYVLCYGTNFTTVKNCTTTGKNAAKQWTSTQDSRLTTFTTSQTTITGLAKNKTHHILLKATDTFGHTSTLLLQNVATSDALAPPFLTFTGAEDGTVSLSWTETDSKNFVRYEICYGQRPSNVTGSSCKNTGNPYSGAVLKTYAPKTVTTATIGGLNERWAFHVKIWLRDSKYGLIPGNNTLMVTCKKGERLVKGKCTVISPPQLKLRSIEGATAKLSWTAYDSKTVTGYDMCYGQTASRVTGTSCQATGNPSGAVLLRVSPATLAATLTNLKEKTLYYAKIWARDSVHGAPAGNSLSLTTCAGEEELVNGKCVAPPPPPTPTPTPEPTPEDVVPPPAAPELPPAPPTEPISAPAEGSVEETFTEFVEETFGEEVAVVVKKVIEVAKKVVQTVARVVKAVAEVVPTQPAVVIPVVATAAVAVAASTGLVSAAPNFIAELIHLAQRLGQGIIGLAGTRRRFPWGKVVDAGTSTPLPQVIVRILDRQTQRIRDTAITDAKGLFASLLPTGQYRLEVSKPGWHLTPAPGYYDGNVVNVAREGVVSIIVAMRPAVASEIKHVAWRTWLQHAERFLTKLSWSLLGFGFALSVLALVKTQSWLNIGIFGLYIVLIGGKLIFQRARRSAVGHVTDAGGKPLPLALVQLYNAETGRLMATKVTSASGQFALLPAPGVYTLMVSKSGFQPYRESHLIVRPGKQQALSLTFTLTPETLPVELAVGAEGNK